MRRTLAALIAVTGIALLAGVASRVDGIKPFIAIAVPYSALAILLIGLSWRVIRWSRSPVPFRIPTVCGQQKSLPWIKAGWLESPYSTPGVIARMGLEVLLFRSLFRNTRSWLQEGPRLTQREARWL